MSNLHSMSSAAQEALVATVRVAIACVGAYLSFRLMMRLMEPNREAKDEARRRYQELMKEMNLPKDLKLDDYEMRIANMLVPPNKDVDWSHVGGCEKIVKDLQNLLVVPLKLQSEGRLKTSRLVSPPKGILLHGPPGCGKTLIARVLAQSVNAHFIELDVSVLTDKWYGESQKLVSALFSFSRKIQPTIIFIDEIDSFLRERHISDNETTGMMKAQFMSLWDGFNTSNDQIVIIGATNNMSAIDPAIMRRMPLRFHIPLPDTSSRADILKILLGERTTGSIPVTELAKATHGLSGADLKEVCRTAALRQLSDWYGNADADELHEDMIIDEAQVYRAILEFRDSVPHEDLDISVAKFLHELETRQITTDESPYTLGSLSSTEDFKDFNLD
uniref:AAA+ ATPase domain-containing protein n=1 Tax=Panagrolaimus sp. JU765 TaxID=591449 RepID=A0AC34QTM8_9BILA